LLLRILEGRREGLLPFSVFKEGSGWGIVPKGGRALTDGCEDECSVDDEVK
jgi:hypothetical protein